VTAKPNKDVFWKIVAAVIIIHAGMALLRPFVPELFAAWIAAFLVMLVTYWIPPRPGIRYTKWIMSSWRTSTLIFIVVTVYALTVGYFFGFYKG
jgi:hypothetical protein